MIELYSGTPGSGKSLHCADRIIRLNRHRKMVVTNFEIDKNSKSLSSGLSKRMPVSMLLSKLVGAKLALIKIPVLPSAIINFACRSSNERQ